MAFYEMFQLGLEQIEIKVTANPKIFRVKSIRELLWFLGVLVAILNG